MRLRKKNILKQDNEQDNEDDKTKQIRLAYISKHNNERDTQVISLMITDGTSNWHYLAVKNI